MGDSKKVSLLRDASAQVNASANAVKRYGIERKVLLLCSVFDAEYIASGVMLS